MATGIQAALRFRQELKGAWDEFRTQVSKGIMLPWLEIILELHFWISTPKSVCNTEYILCVFSASSRKIFSKAVMKTNNMIFKTQRETWRECSFHHTRGKKNFWSILCAGDRLPLILEGRRRCFGLHKARIYVACPSGSWKKSRLLYRSPLTLHV